MVAVVAAVALTCILSTTATASFSSHTVAKLLPTIVIGIAMKSTPHRIATDVTSCPHAVLGVTSPYLQREGGGAG